MGRFDIAPVSQPARDALDRYLRAHPRLGEVPLFPSAEDPAVPIHKNMAGYFLRRAEERAGLPKLERGLWHPYRRAYAVERKHLPDVDVAASAGWRDVATMKASYQLSDAAMRLRAVDNEPETPPDRPTSASPQERTSAGAST